MEEKEIYRHRDLNWLSFNERVLQEAEDKLNPLYERLKFLAIFSSNLDEYFRVRLSQLRQIKHIDKNLRKKLILKPTRLIKQIIARVKEQQLHFGKIFKEEIIPELAENHIHLIDETKFDAAQQEFARAFFEKHILKKLNPLEVDFSEKAELFLENNTLYFLVDFKNSDKAGLVNIPIENKNRFVVFPQKEEEHYIVFLEDVLRSCMKDVFPNREIQGIFEIKLSRDAELYLDDETDMILADKIYASLGQRNIGQPTRLLYDDAMPDTLVKKLRKKLNLGKIDLMPGGKYHNFSDFFSFPDPTDNPELHYEEMPPVPHKVLGKTKDIFRSIDEKDRLVHYPFMPFSHVEDFVKQAANDPETTAIKISFYRIAEDSPLTRHLLTALENGKEVVIFVEAKARFDEKNNIEWGRKFEKKGAKVIYSYPKVKVHSKILLVQREKEGSLRNYAYIGTGNFNSETAKIYCDHALFTAEENIGKELARVFEVLEGKMIIPRTKHLLVSPFNTRREFEKLIRNEMEHAKAGKKAKFVVKMNSNEDREMIDLVYEAGQAGVEIRMLVRGFTSMLPGVEGLSEHIYMTSIVDRFLEHGRIYLFHNGGDEKIYMGSADWMNRNLDRRIEVLTPIYDKDIATELKDILHLQLNDNVKARIQDAEETNQYVRGGKKKIRSQYAIYEYLRKKHKSS